MADLKFVDQHNMVACLEKSDENAKFHQIVDFLSTCSINYALKSNVATIYASYIEQFWNTTTSKIINSVKQIHAIVDGKAVVISESSVRSDLLFNDKDGGSPRRQDTIGGTPAQTRFERVLAQPNEPPLLEGGYTPGSDEGRMTLDELITLCTQLSKQVLDLEKENDAQAVEILNLKKKVKKLERKRKSSISHPRRRKYRQVETSSDDDLDEEDASKQGRRSDKLKPMFKDKDFEELDDHIENVEEETVDAAATGVSTVSAPVSTAGVTISTAEPRTPPTTTTIFDDEDVTMAMAQTLIKMKEQKAKEKGVAITDVEDSSRIVRPVRSITTLQPLPTIDPKDKGKGILVEEEPVKIKIRDQGDLQVQADAERQRQEDDTNAALAKEFDEIQAIINVEYELVVRLTHEEKEMYTIEERARLLAEFFDQRKKQLAAARAEAIRNKPPTKTQVKNKMITYLKHMEEQESAKSDEEAAADYEHEKEELRMWLTASTSTFRPVNTATHTNRVNVSKLRTNAFHTVNGVNTARQTIVSVVKGNEVTAVKASAGCVWRPKMIDLNNVSKDNSRSWVSKRGNPQQALKNKGIFDSGCSRHMTWNKDFLIDYQDIDGGFVAFGGSARGGKITGKGKIRTDKLDFEDVFFVKELKQNLSGEATKANNTDNFNTISTPVNAASASKTYNEAGHQCSTWWILFQMKLQMPDFGENC
ncbi:hypothetical protein Tco_0971916 [Tanacetum coccineum]